MQGLLEDEIRGLGSGDSTGAILDILKSTGASASVCLDALEVATAEIEASGFDRYTKVRFDPAPGAKDTVVATFNSDLFRQDLAAAAHKKLVG